MGFTGIDSRGAASNNNKINNNNNCSLLSNLGVRLGASTSDSFSVSASMRSTTTTTTTTPSSSSASMLATTATASTSSSSSSSSSSSPNPEPPLEWSWPLEHADRERERRADVSAHSDSIHHSGPFEVDRRVLKDVVREKMMGVDVARIEFLSAGTFHKAYLTTLTNRTQVVVRVARRFMPRLKTESEVATIEYLRRYTNVPVPRIIAYDSNPWNRLGGEYIIMDKARGIPLAKVYHGLSYTELVGLLRNLAALIIPLFSHRFPGIGSLYLSDPSSSSSKPIKKSSSPSSTPPPPLLPVDIVPDSEDQEMTTNDQPKKFHVGPIISWPFFGSSRGLLTHPTEMNRGPWSSTPTYLSTCAQREISSISTLENQGKISSHKLHLSPDEVRSSRYHSVRGPGVDGFDESDESDEWDWEESEEDEWEEGGCGLYRDYRRGVRGAFLIRVLNEREGSVRREMGRWEGVMGRLGERLVGDLGEPKEQFALDCHDLSLENIFVSEQDHTAITCVIDWEATTTRPLWAAAHLPSFLRSSVFVSRLFRRVVQDDLLLSQQALDVGRWISPGYVSSLANDDEREKLADLTREWLSYESSGAPLRLAHRCVEWDGWEEGLVDSILGPEPSEAVAMPASGTVTASEEEGEVEVEPSSSLASDVLGHAGEGESNSKLDDLVWGWGVQRHGHGHGHGHGHWHGYDDEDNGSSVPPSRPPFLHLNTSYHLHHHAAGVGMGTTTTTTRQMPLFPLVPLQVASSSSSALPPSFGNGNGKKAHTNPNSSTNGFVVKPPHGVVGATNNMNVKNDIPRYNMPEFNSKYPAAATIAKPSLPNQDDNYTASSSPSSPSSSTTNIQFKKVKPQTKDAKNAKPSSPITTATTTTTTTAAATQTSKTTTTTQKTATMMHLSASQAEKAMEKMLDGTGDICGGRGGELGRRLEAWLVRNGGGVGKGAGKGAGAGEGGGGEKG